MSLPVFLQALHDPTRYPHPVRGLRLLETHSAWVLLTGDYAYKFKKPVNFGFLDFSTLERRRFCCEEELRLNRRLAASLYLGLAPLYGDPAAPTWDGPAAPFEYAVKMRQFDPAAQLDVLAAAGRLQPAQIDRLAARVAEFHAALPPAPADSGWGDPAEVYAPVQGNFDSLRRHLVGPQPARRLDALESWSRAEFERLRPLLRQRREQGWIRECHGDMHLGNMAWHGGEVVIFDALEFNPSLRWIDVMSELGFLLMDMQARGCAGLSHRLRDAYLQRGGDYSGLVLLRFYQVYRALVRAKVAALRAVQHPAADPAQTAALAECADYLARAEGYTRPPAPFLCLTHGVSGSGKSVASQALLETSGAVRLRSDVERKRAEAVPDYSPAARDAVYLRLAELAAPLLRAGFPVVVDATFLQRSQREAFYALGREAGVACWVLACHAETGVLRQRLARRRGDASDAGLAVLRRQQAEYQELTPDETAAVLRLDTQDPAWREHLTQGLARLNLAQAGPLQ